MTMKKNRKMNIPMSIASILLCLVLFSLYMTSGMLAKYTTGGSGKGDGRVAKFSVKLEPVGDTEFNFTQKANPQPTGTYKLKVSNPSEVAVRYTLVLEFPDSLPTYVKVMRGTEEIEPTTVDRKIVELKGGDLAPKGTGEETIRFAVDYNVFVRDVAAGVNTVTLDFSAVANFVQID